MIRGVVQGLPQLRFFARGRGRRYQAIDTIVDTGFDGWVSLPSQLVVELELPIVGEGQGLLADGSESQFDIHEATIRWHQRTRTVWVYSIGPASLIGMALLEGSELNVKARQGGAVTIKPMRRRRSR